ncbi:MAG: aminopeptidase P family protein [Oligosphaeraceae bacterium]|nr:aminopeptidase P family protein [Oligosphaeraceae bacterium]
MILQNQDFQERITRVQQIIAGTDLDAVLVFSTESEPAGVRYFADYWPSFETCAVIIPKQGPAALLIGPESLTYAQSRSRLPDIIQVMDFRESSQPDYPGSPHPDWPEILGRFKIRKLGLAGWYMFPYPIMVKIQKALGGPEQVVEADDIINRVRIQKMPCELQCLRQAAKISEIGFRAVLEKIKPGMSEVELCGIATAAMLANGAEATGYPIWCCSGPNSNQAISRPSLRKVQKSEIIHFSIGAKCEGYSASIGRPVVLGPCPENIRRLMQVGLEASDLTFELMQAGEHSGTVASKIHAFVKQQGYGHALLYGPAHGCGQMECEYPFLETSSTYTLEENMVFMADMFLYENGMGLRWEDGLIVRRGRAEKLSSFARELLILN